MLSSDLLLPSKRTEFAAAFLCRFVSDEDLHKAVATYAAAWGPNVRGVHRKGGFSSVFVSNVFCM